MTEGTFSYAAFFWAIVNLFDDGEGDDIIKNYDRQVIFLFNHYFVVDYVQSEVFGTLSNENEAEALPEESDFDRLKAQRAAKRARLALAV
jgi:hypothetical protein